MDSCCYFTRKIKFLIEIPIFPKDSFDWLIFKIEAPFLEVLLYLGLIFLL